LQSVAAVPREGFRLEVLYVDSASTDGSPEQARALGARVIDLQPERPSAALGRNAGWRAATGHYVLFLDGDTLLHPGFIGKALATMQDPDIAVVWGHRREIAPQQSLYVRAMDLDWVYPPGESTFCGGDALMRRTVLEQVDGFDDSLIAGEEPELCRRIRARGYRILHIDAPMTTHDLAVTRFPAYWKRAFRAGHAYAEVSHRFRHSSDPLWRAEARRNLVHGTFLVCAPLALAAAVTSPPVAAAMAAAGLVLFARTYRRCAWKTRNRGTRLLYAVHSHFQQLPILFGQLSWHLDRLRGARQVLIEYKNVNVG
jgi:glycosyltransferase involved in cell wall biosynthesis